MSMAWQNVLYIVAAILVIMLCVFTLVIRGKAKSDSAQAEKQTQTVTEDEKRAPLFSGLLCSVYFLYFCTCYGYYLIVTWLPSYLQTERGFDGGAIGLASALVAVVGVPGALFLAICQINSVTVKLRLFSVWKLWRRQCWRLRFCPRIPRC